MKTYTFIMGPQLKMSFTVNDHQSVEVIYPNGGEGIIIYNDLYHKEKLLGIQFYQDDINYYMGSYRRPVYITYIVGKNLETCNATIKSIITPTTNISFDCSNSTYEDSFKTIEWIVDSLEPNKRFIFEYTNEHDAAAADDIVKYCENDILATEDAYNAIKGDNVNHPSHYETGKFECFDVMREVFGDDSVKDFCIANTFKYIYRHKRKNGIEDIKKAKWYIDKYLELEENKND